MGNSSTARERRRKRREEAQSRIDCRLTPGATWDDQTCMGCGDVRSADEFHRDKQKRSGLYPRCKACLAPYLQSECVLARKLEAAKRWQKENPERAQARSRRWREANPEKVRARARAQYAADLEKSRAQRRAYYARNLERSRAKSRQAARRYYKLNREVVLARVHERRVLTDGIGRTFTAEEIWQMMESQDHLCAYCEIPLFGSYEVEHMTPLSRGGSNDWTNLCISCVSCNRRKQALTVEEFFERNKGCRAGGVDVVYMKGLAE